MTYLQPDFDHIYDIFYKVPRASQKELSDNGGPFGFDITKAIEIDYLIKNFHCDAIIETGCNLGDTTEYLVKKYNHLKIITCDIAETYVNFVKTRLSKHKNLTVIHDNSVNVIKHYTNKFKCPFYYLDAHWYDPWPLPDELNEISNGVICVDDFDIKHPRFGFDVYNGIKCDHDFIIHHVKSDYFINNVNSTYPLPCLQVGRRSGRAYILNQLDASSLKASDYFIRVLK